MRVALAVASLLLVAGGARAADPVYLDELIETPLSTLQRQFTGLKSEGCYQLGVDRYLLLSIDRKDRKPSRVVLASMPPCRKPETGPDIDIRSRSGLTLGENSMAAVQRLGRPDAAAPPDAKMLRLGEMEYFYICRLTEGCARHTSVYLRGGRVSAIVEWYSE